MKKENQKIIYFIRHGQSEANLKKVYSGNLQVPLTKKRILEAQETANLLRDISFDKIISSHLIRALDTAKIIQKENSIDMPIDVWKKLSEVDAGEYQGVYIDGSFSSILEAAIKSNSGESERKILERASSVIDDLKKIKENTVLVVGHNSFTSVIFYLLNGIKEESIIGYRKKWHMNNAEVRKVILNY